LYGIEFGGGFQLTTTPPPASGGLTVSGAGIGVVPPLDPLTAETGAGTTGGVVKTGAGTGGFEPTPGQ